MSLCSPETASARVNLTTDLRNIIHQINPNDLLCAYKPTFERWAVRTLQILDTPEWWEEKPETSNTDTHNTRDLEALKIVRPLSGNCGMDTGRATDKAMVGWELCTGRHSAESTEYRDLNLAKFPGNRKLQTTSAGEKQLDSKRLNPVDKLRPRPSPFPGKSSTQDARVRDGAEERGSSSPYQRSTSPIYVVFKHADDHEQHMEHYRESYTYKRIRTHKNQFMKRAMVCGLTLQHYPLRYCDTFTTSYTGSTPTGTTTTREHGVTAQSSSTSKTAKPKPSQLLSETVMSERKRSFLGNQSIRNAGAGLRKDKNVTPAVQSLTGLNNGVINMEMYNQSMTSCTPNTKEVSKVLLDVPLMVCRTQPSLPRKTQEKMYQINNSHVISGIVASDTPSTRKK